MTTNLVRHLNQLRHSDVSARVVSRIQEFHAVPHDEPNTLFEELCYCILTANFSARRGALIHEQLKACFHSDPKETLEQKLRHCGYRFPAIRAGFIAAAATKKQTLAKAINTLQGEERRTWLVHNIQGLGYKEASHYLRNIGFDDYAIIDTHIMDILARYRLLTPPKTLTKNRYLTIEQTLREIARKTRLTLAELDLYLWYMETGTILK
ncbi:MAG TPA: N-glycosylase/DNA lyase [Candidatus Thermoplasmatota archaeon]|nr:N-glycosylase/DNA lyase [Candidatus Thermoplasmatota archaeon]